MSNEHFNIQVSIQRVQTVEKKPATRGIGQVQVGTEYERQVSKVLDLAVVADSEEEAYDKVRRFIDASHYRKSPAPHLHRASCDDSGGNLVCGFPPGRSIAG